jgi:hypothetical protein
MNTKIMLIIKFMADIRRFLWNMLLIDNVKYEWIDCYLKRLIDPIVLNFFDLDSIVISILLYKIRLMKYFIRHFDDFITKYLEFPSGIIFAVIW